MRPYKKEHIPMGYVEGAMTAKLKYSDAEQKLLNLIPTNGKSITTEELAEKRYAREEVPFNSRAIVLATLSQLMRKVDNNKENFRIRKGKRRGPRPSEVWAEKRK
jgi:hypothetical protein